MPAQEYIELQAFSIYHMLAPHAAPMTALGFLQTTFQTGVGIDALRQKCLHILAIQEEIYRTGHDVGIQVVLSIGREGLHQQADLLLTAIACANYSVHLLGTLWTATMSSRHKIITVL